MLPSTTSITSTKEELYNALRSRDLTEINGDALPENPKEIELGVLIDTNDEKTWTLLEQSTVNDEGNRRGTSSRRGSGSTNDISLQTAGIKNNQVIAFRFSKTGDVESGNTDELDLDLDDAGWDVILPTLDDDEEPE
jgi:hypothetical protein